MSQHYLAVCPPGLEAPLDDELRALRARRRQTLRGGVAFEGTYATAHRVHLEARCATRVYLRAATFRARDFPTLYKKLRAVDWPRFLPPATPLRVRASARSSRLHHTGRLADTLLAAVRDHLDDLDQPPPTTSDADDAQRVLLRLEDDDATLNLDMSGARLHQRGYRVIPVTAPLREATAAALLDLIDWQPEQPLIDPMCGSGTFLIEAALRALDVAPGLLREGFAFERWPNHDPDRWAALVEDAAARRDAASPTALRLIGHDLDPDAVVAARANAAAADVVTHMTLRAQPLDDLTPPDDAPPGLIVANPPYGARLDQGRGAPAHRQLIDRFADAFPGWRLGLLMPARATVRHDALRFEPLAAFKHGGIPVRWWRATHRG